MFARALFDCWVRSCGGHQAIAAAGPGQIAQAQDDVSDAETIDSDSEMAPAQDDVADVQTIDSDSEAMDDSPN